MSGRNRGGRNYQLNWTNNTDGGAAFGDWTISNEPGYRRPFLVRFKGQPMLRNHGNFTGYQRFTKCESAKRWVERRLRS